jgi:hypothetical protein
VQQHERERREDQERRGVAMAAGRDDRDEAADDERQGVADDAQTDPAGTIEEARQQDARAAGPREEIRTGLDDDGLDALGGVGGAGQGDRCTRLGRRLLRAGMGVGTRSDAVLSVIRPPTLRPNSRSTRQLAPIVRRQRLVARPRTGLCDQDHTVAGVCDLASQRSTT